MRHMRRMARDEEGFLSAQADIRFANAGKNRPASLGMTSERKNAGLKPRHYTEKEKADPSLPHPSEPKPGSLGTPFARDDNKEGGREGWQFWVRAQGGKQGLNAWGRRRARR